jgi:hypothetical protein
LGLVSTILVLSAIFDISSADGDLFLVTQLVDGSI